MDIYEYLKKDHRKVAQLMDEVMASKGDKSHCKALFMKIRDELSVHAETEEATFYAALKDAPETEEKIEHANEEHDDIRSCLKKLEKQTAGTDEWFETFKKFKQTVTHHVDEEEGPIFTKAKCVLSDSQARSLAEKMESLKQQSPQHMKKAS